MDAEKTTIWYEFNESHIPLLEALIAQAKATGKAMLVLDITLGPANARKIDTDKDDTPFFRAG